VKWPETTKDGTPIDPEADLADQGLRLNSKILSITESIESLTANISFVVMSIKTPIASQEFMQKQITAHHYRTALNEFLSVRLFNVRLITDSSLDINI